MSSVPPVAVGEQRDVLGVFARGWAWVKAARKAVWKPGQALIGRLHPRRRAARSRCPHRRAPETGGLRQAHESLDAKPVRERGRVEEQRADAVGRVDPGVVDEREMDLASVGVA
jgi:hypothetical protein